MKTVDEILDLFARRGGTAYFGENVSQTEHSLQAARLANCAGAPDSLVVAALVHDIGHLLEDVSEDSADLGIDWRHEQLGGAWLASRFGPEVTEPVRLHVAAKRYLCAVDASYFDGLSEASKQSLALQGGPMDGSEIAQFESHSCHREALRLRHWDDLAKVPRLVVPGLEHYREMLHSNVRK